MKRLISFLLHMFFPVRSGFDKSKIKSIVVLQFGHIGDIVLSFPFLKELRKIFPHAKITFVCGDWGGDFVTINKNIDEIIIFDHPWQIRKEQNFFTAARATFSFLKVLRHKKFDLAVDLKGNLNSALINLFSGSRFKIGRDFGGYDFPYSYVSGAYDDYEALNLLALLEKIKPRLCIDEQNSSRVLEISPGMNPDFLIGVNNRGKGSKIDFPGYEFPVPEKELRTITNKLLKSNINRFVVIHPTTLWKPRNWGINNYKKLIEKMLDNINNLTVIIIGSNAEIEENNKLIATDPKRVRNFSGELSLIETAALISRADLFIGSDSGPAHLAAAIGSKLVVLMGPGEYPRFAPYNPFNMPKIIRHETCEYQTNNNCKQKYGVDKCAKENNVCMDSIKVDEVFTVVKGLLSCR